MKFVLFIAVSMFLFSCGSTKLNSKDVRKLKLGMTYNEVKAVLRYSSPELEKEIAKGVIFRGFPSNNLLGTTFKDGKLIDFTYEVNPFEKDDSNDRYGVMGSRVEIKTKSFLIDEPSKALKSSVFLEFQNHPSNKSPDTKMVYLTNRKKIAKALSERLGYKFVKSKKKAKAILVLKFGISDGKTSSEVISTPVYQTSYVAPSKTNTNVFNSTGQNLGSIETTKNPYGSYKTEYAGQNTRTVKRTEFKRFASLTLFKKKDLKNSLWHTTAVSEGRTGDIDLIFPYLFWCLERFGGRNVKTKDIKMPIYDTSVRALLGMEVPKK